MKELLNAAGDTRIKHCPYGFGKQKRGKIDHCILPVHRNVNVKAHDTVFHFRTPSSLFPRLGFYVLQISPAGL